jgi:acyl transferase domain-containing protein
VDSAEIRALMEEQLKLSRRLQARVRELERQRSAPMAVVGMGLRQPGNLRTPEEFWEFLRQGGSAVSEIPADRTGIRAVYDPAPGRPGRSYVDRAGFLSDIAGFDADFFGISEREAKVLDPQQRMLLETAWEAMERAGIAVRRSDRLDVGVYLGMMASEYSERLEDRADMTRIDPYYTTGGGLCFGAGRISFVMGLSGPVVSVDTACSSSMTALHLAVKALRNEECRYALVCGSNLLLSANLMVSLSQTRALSPAGRSKSFLASADGYGRGEGVGVLVLMRLDDAERERRPILAVVRGTAANHDGAASGLTAPNGSAQQEVIRAALADADVSPAELGWVEAHGTGTVLGDPIEVGALDAVLGEAVRGRGIPLGLGSVKSRLGHAEAASGVAALMKTVLMLRHAEIPAVVDVADGELNPHIPWERLRFTVPRQTEPWPAGLSRRVAGVNSFGMSGTNVHAVLEAYQENAVAPDVPRTELLVLSAKRPEALAELAENVGAYLDRADPALVSSMCHTLRSGRAPMSYRLAVTGDSVAELTKGLLAQASLAREIRPVESADVIRDVRLRVASDADDVVMQACAALAVAFPSLGVAVPDGVVDAPERLRRMISQSGLVVRLEPGGEVDGAAAVLEWQTKEGIQARPLVQCGQAESAASRLLGILGELFVAGADPRLETVRTGGARLLGDLPTYPFRRKRFWIDEPSTSAAGRVEPVASVQAPWPGDRDAVEAYLMAVLGEVLHAPGELKLGESLLDNGGDSFISTLFITKVEEDFVVRLAPEDLPLDLPLSELVTELAGDIVANQADTLARSRS